MLLSPGARLGPYEVISAIGAGGMGEVYRARDARLNRAVALKILPAEFAADAERAGRFEQEARATAARKRCRVQLRAHAWGRLSRCGIDVGAATKTGVPACAKTPANVGCGGLQPP